MVVDGRLEDPKFEASLGYIAITCINTYLKRKRNEGRERRGAEEEERE